MFQRETRKFSKEATALAFPLGGIGTGNVSLGVRGEWCDWEIFNKADKGQQLPNTFFAIWAQAGAQKPVVRVLEASPAPPYNLSHGFHPFTAMGLPRLTDSYFVGEYPFAHITFEDKDLPIEVQLEAFTPLIPLEAENSGLPCAILTYILTNSGREAVNISVVGSITNPVGGITFDKFGNLAPDGLGQNINDFRQETTLRGLHLCSKQYPSDALAYGDMSMVTTHSNVSVKPAWLRGDWYDYLHNFWDDFSSDGRLDDLGYTISSETGKTDTGSLALLDILEPGETKSYRYILTWFFPNRLNSWANRLAAPVIRNHYATRFDSSWAVAQYVVNQIEYLEGKTRLFHKALFESTLPLYVLDAISANIVPLRSNTCFWLEDGRFFGYEGCFDEGGCCEGSCTHVWSYAQTLAFLFPNLEREMRRIEFVDETAPNGFMNFRNHKSLGDIFIWRGGTPDAAADGQCGSILRGYREWLLSGDKVWLAQVWPGIKKAINFASMHWDADGDGVLSGAQHNTYDIEFYGPNPLCSIYYLAALRAVEELANIMGEAELSQRCHQTFLQGSQNLEALLWNGEYYIQHLDSSNTYKYQHATGCLSDQLLGQLYARILNLGDLLPAEHVQTAINSIFKYNFKLNFQEHVNRQRSYVLNDEAGLIMCSWPLGGRPAFPFVYSDEVWTGTEYQVAAHLIYEGAVSEGLTIVKALRKRHDGIRRNPWDEVECGHHYARSMSSWAILLALSGFHCNTAAKELSFRPVSDATASDTFRAFWSTGQGWGIYSQQLDAKTGLWQPKVEVLGGSLKGVVVKACGVIFTLL